MKELILGGVRSGKSRLAEQHAQDSGLQVVYIATAEVRDEEMRQRVAQHQARRPDDWKLIEARGNLAEILQRESGEGRCLLVDCLTLWLTQLLCDSDATKLRRECDTLLQALPQFPGHIIFVSVESNLGVMPMDALTRRYCDEIGLLHQALARQCDKVILTVAGLPHYLKGNKT